MTIVLICAMAMWWALLVVVKYEIHRMGEDNVKGEGTGRLV